MAKPGRGRIGLAMNARRSDERCAGHWPVLTADAWERFKQPQREDFDLRLANKILKKASVYFAQAELDPARADRGGRSLQ
jgi:hypothetical protein